MILIKDIKKNPTYLQDWPNGIMHCLTTKLNLIKNTAV